MDAVDDAVERLRSQITAVESELSGLRSQLAATEQIATHKTQPMPQNGQTYESVTNEICPSPKVQHYIRTWELEPQEYKRYGRQLIMPEVGIRGQSALKKASVLIVGLGGLGCPAAAYLAGAGVGKIGLVDGDTVELSNLHRQILHDEGGIGKEKVDSVAERLRALNSNIEIITHNHHLTPSIAVSTMSQYDMILNCTDRPSTRYLISDAAILANKPCVTASALRTEGQLMVLNDSRFRDPVHRFCYRCVFPKPPPAESILTCGEGGILGPVVGVMGVLMAMEVMKIILFHKDHVSITAADLRASTGGEMSYDDDGRVTEPPSLLLYSAYGSPLFRSVRLRGQRKDCISCSDKGTITRETLASGSLDYDEFCGVSHPADILSPSERVTATTYNNIRETFGKTQVLIDVREKVQFDICHLKGSINLPYSDLSSNPISSIARLEGIINTDKNCAEPHSLYFICRFGNDSQLAVSKLQKLAHTYNYIGDVKGGLRAWRQQVDADFPDY